MKKVSVVLSIVTLFLIAITACQPKTDSDQKKEVGESMDSADLEEMSKVQYTCTMHPEVVTDAPGKCPKCGMDLVKKEDTHEGDMDHTHSDSTIHE